MNYLIVGASTGIGAACVKKLADANNRLYIVARSTDKLEALAGEFPGSIIPITYDLHDLDHIGDIFLKCKEDGVKLDGMVFSAGMDGLWPVKVNNISKLREVMDVNCFSFIELGKAFFSKRHSNDGSSIVAISSIASQTVNKGMIAYSTSKVALDMAVKTMAAEFVSRKIRVNAILPGGVSTPLAEEKGKVLDGLVGENATGDPQPFGMIPAEQIAESVAFLLSERSKYMTGSLMVIGGGRM